MTSKCCNQILKGGFVSIIRENYLKINICLFRRFYL